MMRFGRVFVAWLFLCGSALAGPPKVLDAPVPQATATVPGVATLGAAGGALLQGGAGPVDTNTLGGVALSATTAAKPVGTTLGTVAAGNDSRIVGALQTTGGTMTGSISSASGSVTYPTLNATTGMTLGSATNAGIFPFINAAAGASRCFVYESASVYRWQQCVNGSETGSNVGGDYSVNAYADMGGTALFTVPALKLTRSTGLASMMSLALSGPQVAGINTLYLHNTLAPASAALTPSILTQTGLSGTATGSSAYVNQFTIGSDTLNVSAVATGALYHFDFAASIGGTGMTGSRGLLSAHLNFTASSSNTANGQNYVAFGSTATASAGDGGASGSPTNGRSSMFGGGSNCILQTAATFFSSCIAQENDVSIDANSSAYYKSLMQFVQKSTDYTQGLYQDAAVIFANQPSGTAPGWNNVITIGAHNGWWPVHAGGTILGTLPADVSGGPVYAAGIGIDFSAVTFTTSAIKLPGFSISPTGAVTESNAMTPATSSAACSTGQHAWDTSYDYRCVATNTWKRLTYSAF